MINLEDIPQLSYKGKLQEGDKQPGLASQRKVKHEKLNDVITMRWHT